MNAPRVDELDLVQFLLATPKVCSASEAGRPHPDRPDAPAHDAYSRLLNRLEPEAATLWHEVRSLVVRNRGVLVIDDSTLDKPYATQIELVSYHWSGKHHRVVKGINLISLVWTDGDRMYPCDYRVYDSEDGLTKNDHAQAMLRIAYERGFQPNHVLFDGWYASVENLKFVRSLGWKFLTRMKHNRKIRINRGAPIAVSEAAISSEGTAVWLPEFGEVKVFRIVDRDGNAEHWFTNDLAMTELARVGVAELGWSIEEYHRGLKQYCGAERCQSFSKKAQRNYLRACLRVFVRLEWVRYSEGITWFQTKLNVIRKAVADYVLNPRIRLPFEATA
jgi:putative transposase